MTKQLAYIEFIEAGQPVDPAYGQGGHPLPPHVGGGPSGSPGHPDQGGVATPPIYYPVTVWPPAAQPKPEGDFLLLMWVPNVGLTWVVVDKDLMPSHDLPDPPAHVGGGPAPTPAPKA